MAYTAAQTAAMNKQGQALLNSQKNGTYKPPASTPAKPATPSTPSATTLGRGGSRPGDTAATYTPAPTPKTTTPASTTPKVTLGGGGGSNSVWGSDSGSSGDWGNRETPYYGQYPSQNYSQSYEDLKRAMLQQQTAALEKQLGNSLSNLDTQQAEIAPYYYDKRNQAAARSDVAALNFAQMAAARGISGNAGAMPEIYRNNALQGQIGALDQAEAAENTRIERDRVNLRNNFESDLVAAQAGIEAKALQDYIDSIEKDRQFALDEAGVTGTYNGQSTLQGQQQQLANQMAQLQIDAQTIQNSYLPQTLKDEAALLKQQVEAGRIDINTALTKLSQIKAGGSQQNRSISFSEALKAWEKGIDTPEIRSVLGI